MIRMVNNCAITNNLAVGKDSLKWVDDVRGELYYIIDDVLYLLREQSEEEGALVYEISDIKENERHEWPLKAPTKVDEVDRDSFFLPSYPTTLIMHTIRRIIEKSGRKLVMKILMMKSVGCTISFIRMTVMLPL